MKYSYFLLFRSSTDTVIVLYWSEPRLGKKNIFFRRLVLLLKTIRVFSSEKVYLPNGIVVRRVCVYG